MKRIIKANSVSSEIPAGLDSLLQDFAQESEFISYKDIINFGKHVEHGDIYRLKRLFKQLREICAETGLDYYEIYQEDEEAEGIIDEIVGIVKG